MKSTKMSKKGNICIDIVIVNWSRHRVINTGYLWTLELQVEFEVEAISFQTLMCSANYGLGNIEQSVLSYFCQ